MSDNNGYLIYPQIDGNYDFPPEVRQAIADSPELQAETVQLLLQLISDPSGTVRHELESLYIERSNIIDGGSP